MLRYHVYLRLTSPAISLMTQGQESNRLYKSAKEIIKKIEILTDVLDFYFLKWEN